MSLYSDYFKCEGYETLEIPDIGFATYKIVAPECYIRDLYVAPEYRLKGAAVKLGDIVTSIAKEKGCNTLIGSVKPSYKDSNVSLRMLQSYGMVLGKAEQDTILLYKRI